MKQAVIRLIMAIMLCAATGRAEPQAESAPKPQAEPSAEDTGLTPRPARQEPAKSPDSQNSPRMASIDAASASDAFFLHDQQTMNCGGRMTGGGCRLTVDEGALVTLRVKASVPGILSANVAREDKSPDALSRADFEKLTKGVAGATSTAQERGEFCSQCDSPLSCFRDIRRGLREVQQSIDKDLSEYSSAICLLKSADDKFVNKVGVGAESAEAVQETFFAGLTAAQLAEVGTAENFIAFWPKLRALIKDAPDELADFALPYESEYGDRDFDLVLSFTSNHPDLITAPRDSRRVQVRLKNGWGVSTSTALMTSGLADDEYTTQAYTVKVGAEDVEKKRAVREDRDVLSPEIAFLVNLVPKAPSRWGRSIVSVGVGLGADSGGRLYATYGWRFGQAGAFHIGAALGRVKRLSKNVDVEDVGTDDPNSSRRDVMRPSITVGISWRLTD